MKRLTLYDVSCHKKLDPISFAVYWIQKSERQANYVDRYIDLSVSVINYYLCTLLMVQ